MTIFAPQTAPSEPASDWLQEIAAKTMAKPTSVNTDFLYRKSGETTEQYDAKTQMFHKAIEPLLRDFMKAKGIDGLQSIKQIEEFRRSDPFIEAVSKVKDKVQKGQYDWESPSE